VMTWKDNEHIIYRSRKQSFNDFKGKLFIAGINGGLSEELPFSVGGFCSYSPDGKRLAMNRVFREFRTWKYYRGGMADDIWIYDFGSMQWSNITHNDEQDIEQMWHQNKIYYLSDRDKTMNLYVYDLNNGQTRKVTSYTDYDIKFASLGDKDIVFEKGGLLYILNLASEQATQVKVQIAGDDSWSRSEFVDGAKFIEGWDLSPDGNRLSIVARGDVFTVPAESGITRNLTNTNNAHERDAVWSPDGNWIAYISDTTGEDEIYLKPQKGDGKTIRLTTTGDNYKYHLRFSPDSRKIMWSDRKQTLQYVNVDTRKITVVEHSDAGEYIYYDWSPDSKWIAYARPEWQTQNRIFIYNLASRQPTAVTDNWFTSYEPTFTHDGKYLLLTSDRDFNPTFSNVEFQISYQNLSKVYLLALAKSTESPFAPENNEVRPAGKSSDDADDKASKKKSDKSSSAKENDGESGAAPDVKIDLDGITSRLVSLPIDPSQYFNLQYRDGNIYYQKQKAGEEKATLMIYKLKERKEEELGQADSYLISFDGKKMAVNKSGSYYVINLPTSKFQADKNADLSNMKIWVDRHAEWQEIFNECWRQMRDFFYAPNMNGVDWNAMKVKYGPLVPDVNHRADLTYLIGEMIGELSIGHAYVGGGDEPKPERIQTGLLGAEIVKDGSGFFRIIEIFKGANWNSALRSPLTEPGVNINTGDLIIAVNGTLTNSTPDLYSLLVNTAGKQVELTVNSKPTMDGSRIAIVVPISDERNLNYFGWVEHNIHYVDSVSKGKIGYLHIPNMGVEGLNEFIKHFYPQLNKRALIIDDRGNGGGFVSGLVSQRLVSQLVYYNMARNQTGGTDPQMLLGPKALLTDQYSASDGDIIAYRFKTLKIGPVIGQRTWGGVTGIRGTLPIMDGGFLNRPEFAPYTDKGFVIEGYGVDPDIVVEQDPAQEYIGNDQQLNKAIEVMMDSLKNGERVIPQVPQYPDKTK
ncbi:MAG: PDZ domain-containing protein, partial [Chitinophagales bacterium]